jgi:AraC-like DNA-binding protein
MKRLPVLHAAVRRLAEERYVVDRPVDARGQYQLELPADFPLMIKRLRFDGGQQTRPLTWHTYFEIFLPLGSACRLRIGEQIVALAPGDLLVMDHLKLHAVLDFPRRRAEALVIRFLPELVRSRAPLESDQLLLLPFTTQVEDRPHILRAGDPEAAKVHAALAELLKCYAQADETLYWQTGSRAFFLVVLHFLAQQFRAADQLKKRSDQQQKRTGRLRKLFEYVGHHYAERISLPHAATIAGLSKPQFHVVFKQATGMSLLAYLTQVRLAEAVRLLRETDASIAEIASQIGFADQSYFDRRFRRHFGCTPVEYRTRRPAANR